MSTKQKISAHVIGLVLVLHGGDGFGCAQQPSPSPSPKTIIDARQAAVKQVKTPATIRSSRVWSLATGDSALTAIYNKYQSDLNYKAGPRLFDSSFLLRRAKARALLFETFLVNSTGWGADPQGNMRVSVEQPEWYRFDATYRRFKYFRFLNNFANPNWVFSPATFQRAAEADHRRARIRHQSTSGRF